MKPEIDLEALAAEIACGERRMHELPKELPPATAAAVRRRALELRAERDDSVGADGLRFDHVAHASFDAERAAAQNCENLLGVAQVPIGVAGPLRWAPVGGSAAQDDEGGEVYVPLATTEGALVASINRGCRAITVAGGARVAVDDVGMTRAPAFRVSGLEETERLLDYVEQHRDELQVLAEGTSRFLRLQEILPRALGNTVLLRFRFTTGDAMGMNMVTIACDRVTARIEEETGIPCVALSGNYCTDKKPAAVNFERGRGKQVTAEVVLDRETLERVLKTRSEALVEVNLRKNLHGSIAAGAMGYNAQFANALAALFVATGQDLAHVVEGSMGLTHFEEREDGAVYAAVHLPDLPVAAIGGGTGLDTQRECLALLGVRPDPERPGAAARRLAAIAGAVVLAGELSLMSAFTSRDLARAHERLGRSTSS